MYQSKLSAPALALMLAPPLAAPAARQPVMRRTQPLTRRTWPRCRRPTWRFSPPSAAAAI